jgi:YgiT-type zinc finger domain-containing protein
MVKITQCPTCGSNNIKKVHCDWTSTYCGKKYTVPALEYYCCPDCGEEVYDRYAVRKIQAYSPAYAKKRKTKVVEHV